MISRLPEDLGEICLMAKLLAGTAADATDYETIEDEV